MGVWSSPLAVWPQGLVFPHDKLSPSTVWQFADMHGVMTQWDNRRRPVSPPPSPSAPGDDEGGHVVEEEEEEAGEVEHKGLEDGMASADEEFALFSDTAKIVGYLTDEEQAAWLDWLSVIMAHNKAERPDVATHGVSMFFHCSDWDNVYALHVNPRQPQTLFLRVGTANREALEPKDAVPRWRHANLWIEPTLEEMDEDEDYRGRINVERVKAQLLADVHFGAPTSDLWLRLMTSPSPPPIPAGMPRWMAKAIQETAFKWPQWTPAPGTNSAST